MSEEKIIQHGLVIDVTYIRLHLAGKISDFSALLHQSEVGPGL